MRRHVRTLMIASIFLLTPAASYAQQYIVIDLGTLGGTNSVALGINASGQVTGRSTIINSDQGAGHVFITDATTNTMIDLGTLGGKNAVGRAINNIGQVVGQSNTVGPSGSSDHAFVTSPSTNTMIDLGTFGGPFSSASSINSIGQVTGAASFGDIMIGHAFITNPENNSLIDLGTLGGNQSEGAGINSSGQVTGTSTLSGDTIRHAFLKNSANSTMIDLGTLGGTNSYGYGINAGGQVTGYSYLTGDRGFHAFITSPANNEMIDIGALDGVASYGYGINSNGQVIGEIIDPKAIGGYRGFIYTNSMMTDLNTLISSSQQAKFKIISARGINDAGQIAAIGLVPFGTCCLEPHAVLLTPAISVSPTIIGTVGTNNWYVSAVALSWEIAGLPTPSKSGCGNTNITNDTKGTLYTCTATNSLETVSQSVTIKKDTLAPAIAVSSPVDGATYGISAAIPANYVCSDALSGIANCTGTVNNAALFDTSSLGPKSLTVTGIDNAGNVTRRTVSYTIATGLDGGLASDRSLVTFSSQQVGTSSTARAIAISNPFTTSVGLRSVTMGGPNAAMFSRSTSCGAILAAGATCTINVFFRPTTMGLKSGSVIVTTTGGGAKVIDLAGNGLAPPLTLSSTAIDFSGQLQGSLSPARQIGITNNWTESVRLSSLTVTGTDSTNFSRSTTCGAILPAGSFCTASIYFRPGTLGSKSAQLNIASQVAGSPQVVTLSGTGTFLRLDTSVASLAFGDQPTGTASTARTFTISNSGTQALRLTAIAITGTDATSYSRSTTCGPNLAVATSCEVRTFFKPTALGTRTATLTISATGTTPKVINLSGAGI